MSTSFLGLSIPFTPTQLALGVAGITAVLSAGMGSYAMLNPRAYAAAFGFHETSATTRHGGTNPFIFVAGGRVVAGSLTLLGLLALRETRAVGVYLATAVLTGAVDSWAVWKFGVKAEESEDETAKVLATPEERKERAERIQFARQQTPGHVIITAIFSAVGLWMVYDQSV